MTLDLDIGFLEVPKDLRQLLERMGYIYTSEQDGCTVYEHSRDHWPQLFHYSTPAKAEGDELPNWERAGFNVVSELNINYPYSDLEAFTKAEELSDKLAKTYKVVICDQQREYVSGE